MAMLKEVYICGAARTPVGSFQGVLSKLDAPTLGVSAVKGALAQANLKPEQIEELYFGNVLQAGVGQNPARQVVLGSGMPEHVEATTINKVCASGMKAIMLATQNLQTGQRDIMVAGGMESMSKTPYYFPRSTGFGNVTALDGIAFDGLQDAYKKVPMGNCVEDLVAKLDITREDQDDFCIESYRRSAAAWAAGKFDAEIAPVVMKDPKKGEVVIKEDEEYKKVILEKVKSLRAVFKKEGGTITAANASTLNDGASAVVLATEDKAKELNVKPMAKIVAFADAACAPVDFGIAPAAAIPLALKKAGLTLDDMAKIEVNEAFSGVSKANEKLLGLDPAKTNVNGGAVSLGHALGSSGSRIVVTLVHLLQPGEYGVAGVCNGGGGASAIVIQRL